MEIQASSLGATILTLVVLINLIGTLVAIWAATRRNPPLDRELYQRYATIAALAQCKEEHDAKCAAIHVHQDKIDADQYSILRAAQAGIEKTIQDIVRALGRIEGKLENLRS